MMATPLFRHAPHRDVANGMGQVCVWVPDTTHPWMSTAGAGPHSYGIYSYGLYSYGQYSYGRYSCGRCRAGRGEAGMHTKRAQQIGQEHSYGIYSYGLYISQQIGQEYVDAKYKCPHKCPHQLIDYYHRLL